MIKFNAKIFLLAALILIAVTSYQSFIKYAEKLSASIVLRKPILSECTADADCLSLFCSPGAKICCNHNQCSWGDGKNFPYECVNTGAIRVNAAASMICKSTGKWKIFNNGWGCDKNEYDGCDSGTCQQIGNNYYCRSCTIMDGYVETCSATTACPSGKTCTNGVCCDTSQCGWSGGGMTKQCVNNDQYRENADARLLCQNGTWKIPLGGWGCDNIQFGGCVSGTCKSINGKSYCTQTTPFTLEQVSHSYSKGAFCTGTCTNNCTINQVTCSGTNKYYGCGDKDGDGCLEKATTIADCPGNQTCSNNKCNCVPNCTDKVCGADGCGSSCGSCDSNKSCNDSGQCISGCSPTTCQALNRVCGSASNGCGNNLNCGTCPQGQNCNANGQCVANCTLTTCLAAGRICGNLSDGCGGTLNCGTCISDQTCNSNGQCVSGCTPATCSNSNYTCGNLDDGCGGTLNCGTCASPQICSNGNCTASCNAHNTKKCDEGNLYWYNSCSNREELVQSCGNSSETTNFRCQGNILQKESIIRDCANAACNETHSWQNFQDCALTGKICNGTACVSKDNQAPVINILEPKGTIYSARTNLRITTNERSECHYDIADKTFSAMTLALDTTDKLEHSISIALNAYGKYKYYIKCRDEAQNANIASTIVQFNYLTAPSNTTTTAPAAADKKPPVISSINPSGNIDTPSPKISVATNEKATCKYNSKDDTYSRMADYMESDAKGTNHYKTISLDSYGEKTYYIRCVDESGNNSIESAQISFNYILPKTNGPLISNVLPKEVVYQPNVLLTLSTNDISECRYALTDIDYKLMENTLTTEDGKSQQALLKLTTPGIQNYYVRCADKKGNSNDQSTLISFEYKNKDERQPTVTNTDTESAPEIAAPVDEDENTAENHFGAKEIAISALVALIVIAIITITTIKRGQNNDPESF